MVRRFGSCGSSTRGGDAVACGIGERFLLGVEPELDLLASYRVNSSSPSAARFRAEFRAHIRAASVSCWRCPTASPSWRAGRSWRSWPCLVLLRLLRPTWSSIRCRYWSGQQDLNLRPSAPKADALPGCAIPRPVPGPPSDYGSRRPQSRSTTLPHGKPQGLPAVPKSECWTLSPGFMPAFAAIPALSSRTPSTVLAR